MGSTLRLDRIAVTLTLTLTLAACSPSVVSGNAPDAAANDVPAGDAAPDTAAPDAADVAPTPDVPSPDAATVDGAVTPDAGVTEAGVTEVGVTEAGVSDVVSADGAGVDVAATDGAVVDAGASLTGTWRVVRYEFTDGAGRATTVTDRDTPVVDPGTGMTTPVRVNGMLFLEATHMAITFGSLAMGHFYAYDTTSPMDTGYSATGFSVPGLLDDATGTFAIPGGTNVRMVRNGDGTIRFEDMGTGARTTLARTTDAGPALTAINTNGLAMTASGVTVTAAHPRVALLWDRLGDNNWVETQSTAVRFVGRFASYPLVVAGAAPTEAVVRWMGSDAAVARIVLYDDNNSSTRYDAATDGLLAVSPVVITWRAAGAFTGSGAFALRHVPAGLRYGHAHLDYALGREDVVPYDHGTPVSPDLHVPRTGPGRLPEIL